MEAEPNHKPRRPYGSCLDRGSEATPVRHPDHVVYVVDDDIDIREALSDLLTSRRYNARTFASAAEYIGSDKPNIPSCLVLDLELPDINGLDLQAQLAGEAHPPIVFITGHGDIASSVRAMKAGAMDFLPKPFSASQLLSAIGFALAHDRRSRTALAGLEDLRARHSALTPRQRQTLPWVVSGLLNKQAAAMLGISVVTMQIHRGNIMRKMRAGSLSDLVRMSEKLQIPLPATSDSQRPDHRKQGRSE